MLDYKVSMLNTMLQPLKRSRKLVSLFLIALLGGSISSCLPGAGSLVGPSSSGNLHRLQDGDTGCEEIPPPSVHSQHQGNSALTTEVYVDGSGSMLGYVKPDNSRYITVLNLISQRFASDNLKYFRIGYDRHSTKAIHLLSDSDFRLARKEEFYVGGGTSRFPPVTSQLVPAIESLNEGNKVVVLISDLGEDEGDVAKILKAIEANVLTKAGHAVAIVGIKSEFDGTVYSPSDFRYNFPYTTAGLSVAAYRPFYLLIMGPSRDVRGFLGNFASLLASNTSEWFEAADPSDAKKTIKTIEASLFDPNILPSLTFKNTSVESQGRRKSEIREVVALRGKNTYLRLNQDSMNKALSIRTNESISQEYQLSLSGSTLAVLDSSKLENSMLPQTFKVSSKSKIQIFDPSSKKFNPITDRNPEIKLKLTGDTISLQNNPFTLLFELEINPTTLTQDNIYLYQVRFEATSSEVPEWWKTWNLEQITDKDGTKSYQLLHFLTSLRDRAFQYMETGELCYVIQRQS